MIIKVANVMTKAGMSAVKARLTPGGTASGILTMRFFLTQNTYRLTARAPMMIAVNIPEVPSRSRLEPPIRQPPTTLSVFVRLCTRTNLPFSWTNSGIHMKKAATESSAPFSGLTPTPSSSYIFVYS